MAKSIKKNDLLKEQVERFAVEIGAIDNAQLIIDELNLRSLEQALAVTDDELHDAAANAIGPQMSLGGRTVAVELVNRLTLSEIYLSESVAAAFVEQGLDYVSEIWCRPLGGGELSFEKYELVPVFPESGCSIFMDEGETTFLIRALGNHGEITRTTHSESLTDYLDGEASSSEN